MENNRFLSNPEGFPQKDDPLLGQQTGQISQTPGKDPQKPEEGGSP
jgi:hypothetical protein